MGVLFSMRHRGAGGAAARACSIVHRFGVTATPMEERLRRFDELTAEFGVRPSWAITACILDRNRAAVGRFVERGVEFAIHGLVHDDHSLRSLDEQRASIARAAELFRAAGVPYRGFRCPFLRGNPATDQAVRELGVVRRDLPPDWAAPLPRAGPGPAVQLQRGPPRQPALVHPRPESIRQRPAAGLVPERSGLRGNLCPRTDIRRPSGGVVHSRKRAAAPPLRGGDPPSPPRRSSGEPPRRSRSAERRQGNAIRKHDPSGRSKSAQARPPIPSTVSRTMLSPSPVPSTPVTVPCAR